MRLNKLATVKLSMYSPVCPIVYIDSRHSDSNMAFDFLKYEQIIHTKLCFTAKQMFDLKITNGAKGFILITTNLKDMEKFLIFRNILENWAQMKKWAALSSDWPLCVSLESLVHIYTQITNTGILSPVYNDNSTCDCRGQWIRQLPVDDSSD